LSFILGFIAGFMVAAPVGAASMLIVRRAFDSGFAGAFAVGLGAATGDAVFGALALAGVGTVLGFVATHDVELRLIGGLFLLAAAVVSWRKPARRAAVAPPAGRATLAGGIAAGFVLTITNPITPAAFIMVFAALGLGEGHPRLEAASLMLGVYAGAIAWMGGLAWAASHARQRMTDRFLWKAGLWTSGLLAVCGVYAIGSAILRATGG
jgi:threonine/homoserine/homoserine lactone efflux protein